jgi:hypothetical protein
MTMQQPEESWEIKQALQEVREAQVEARQRQRDFSEARWESLPKEEQLQVFCAVSRRLLQGEIQDERSYRGVLYDVFCFGPEAYGAAYDAGFFEIHNSIYRRDKLEKAIIDWARDKNIPGSAINDLLSTLDTI